MHDTAPSRQNIAAPSRGLRLVAVFARWVWWLIMAIAVLFGATWGLLHGLIVPRIEDFRPRLESLASNSLGMPVRVGQISGESRGLIPTFELKDVTLQDSMGRQVLEINNTSIPAFRAASMTALYASGDVRRKTCCTVTRSLT